MAARFKFPPMLGPPSQHPEGSRDWALCLGNELDYKAERAVEYGVSDFHDLMRKVMASPIPPWTVWPDPPCGSADAYFELCTGYTYSQLYALVSVFVADHGLPDPEGNRELFPRTIFACNENREVLSRHVIDDDRKLPALLRQIFAAPVDEENDAANVTYCEVHEDHVEE